MMPSHPGGSEGATRSCPHCKSTILNSALRCPVCRHYLHFDVPPEEDESETVTALKVDATIPPPGNGEIWEYQVVIAISDETGREMTRQVVGVGGLGEGEKRSIQLAVEVIPTPYRRHQA